MVDVDLISPEHVHDFNHNEVNASAFAISGELRQTGLNGAYEIPNGTARQAGIPKQLFAMVPDPAVARDLRRNMAEVARLPPEDVHVFNHWEANASAFAISGELLQAGLKGAYEAFAMLRPGAFKADLWRYMKLWSEGGLYIDDSVRFKKPLDSWLDFDHDSFVLVQDIGDRAYWGAILAAKPKLPALLHAIAAVVRHVEERFYGECDLEVTGPMLLYEQVQTWAPPNDMQVKLRLTMVDDSDTCGPYPAPPCSVNVVDFRSKEVIAYKDMAAHAALHTKAHYSRLWADRQVYCDEPSDIPC